MAQVLHSAPRYAASDGVVDALTARLGDALLAIREEHGEIVLNVARDSVESTLRTLRDDEAAKAMSFSLEQSPTTGDEISIIACLAGLATALVLFVALWRGTPVPGWMPLIIAMAGGFELAQFGQGLWFKWMADRHPEPDSPALRARWGQFAWTGDNAAKAQDIIARYPAGRQRSAVMPLLDLAQRQVGAEEQTQGWLPLPVMEFVAHEFGKHVWLIGPWWDTTYPATHLGDDASVIDALPEDVASVFANAARPAIIIGGGALAKGGLVPALGAEGLADYGAIPAIADHAPASGVIGYAVKDRYLTNAIGRASPTLQRCSAELIHGVFQAEAAE
eukprot:gene3540-3585_t